MYKNKLTYLQKAAIEGEISYLISTASHDTDILFRLFCILKSSPKKDKEFLLDCFQSLTNFPKEVYTKILLEVDMGTVPLWLWEDKVIEDIKYILKYGDSPESEDSVINKKVLRKSIIKSAFILFCKRLTALSLEVPIKLCKRILTINELDFLHSSCFAIISDFSEVYECDDYKEDNSPDTLMEIFKMPFDSKDILSYKIETEAMQKILHHLGEVKTDEGTFSLDLVFNDEEDEEDEEDDNFKIDRTNGIYEDLPDDLKEIVSRLTKEKKEKKNRKRKNPFIVKKVANNATSISILKTFKSVDEAENYIEKIIHKDPELKKEYTFVIEDSNDKNVMYVFSED